MEVKTREAHGRRAMGRMRRLSRERLSRGLFVLPTLFTVGNLFSGYLSVWYSIHGVFEWAAGLIFRNSKKASTPFMPGSFTSMMETRNGMLRKS